MKSIEAALLDLVAICDSMRIAYAVMGGLAVRVHGIPRPTHDVDLTLSIDRAELGELFEQLEGRGYSVPQPYKDGWLDEIAEMPLIKVRAYLDAGHGIDVDIFVAESEFQKSLIQRRIPIESNHLAVPSMPPSNSSPSGPTPISMPTLRLSTTCGCSRSRPRDGRHLTPRPSASSHQRTSRRPFRNGRGARPSGIRRRQMKSEE